MTHKPVTAEKWQKWCFEQDHKPKDFTLQLRFDDGEWVAHHAESTNDYPLEDSSDLDFKQAAIAFSEWFPTAEITG